MCRYNRVLVKRVTTRCHMAWLHCSEELGRKENHGLKPVVDKLKSIKDTIDEGSKKYGEPYGAQSSMAQCVRNAE